MPNLCKPNGMGRCAWSVFLPGLPRLLLTPTTRTLAAIVITRPLNAALSQGALSTVSGYILAMHTCTRNIVLVLGCSVAMTIAGCAGLAPRPVTASDDGDASRTIADVAVWNRLAAHDASSVFGAIESVKVIVDRHQDRVYFLQSRRWPLHFNFAAQFLAEPGDAVGDGWTFNQTQYHDPARRFVLGTLTHFAARNLWSFELYAGDTLDVAATVAAIDAIRQRVFFAGALRYRPLPAAHIAAQAELAEHIDLVTSAELFGAVEYQAIELGMAIGRVRIIDAPLVDIVGHAQQMATLTAQDIAVISEPPLEIPPVAGIISNQLLAPLGHIAVLAHSRHTPTAAQRDATTLPDLLAQRDQWVRLTIAGSHMQVQPLDAAAASRALAAARPQPKLQHAVRLATDHPGLLRLADIASDDVAHFGAKTAQLARVAQLGVATPRAFGVPFAAYLDFLHSAGLDVQLAQMLKTPAFVANPVERRRQLDNFRNAILAAPVPARITVPVAAAIALELAGARNVRLRSSTNAEDLAGFSGAGLYQSVRIQAGKTAELERGLRAVWASVWTFEAFEERRAFGIDQARVAMAILVQESIDTDDVSGVVISGNPFYQGRPAVFINAAPRGATVTSAAGGDVPEQVLRYTFKFMVGIERISRSAQARDRDLLTDQEIERLTAIVERLHRGFLHAAVGTANALDIEFLLTRAAGATAVRQFVIVQARPYAMGWAGARAQHND